MLRFVKIVGCLALLAAGLRSASGFSLNGPDNVPWEIPTIGYALPGDIGVPHNLGEEYRLNTPTIYYAYDQNFTDYFGSNGVWNVDQAASILNNLTNFSRYSSSLNEIPTEGRRVNSTAQTLRILDLKSAALWSLLGAVGLSDSERFVWTLRTRDVQPGLSCPFMIYTVIQFSFDPVNWQPSSYINGALYTYIINEICTGPNPLGVTLTFSTDQGAEESQPATSFLDQNDFNFVIPVGQYLTGLTRDDVGGLRYIYEPTNVNWEAISSDSVLLYTNIAGGQQLLLTSNLTLLASQALTNDQPTLQALYPNLQIVSSTNIFTNVWVTNISGYFTNYPLDPIGTPPHLVLLTNRTLTVQTDFHYIFGNVVTIVFTNGGWSVVPLPDISTHISREWLTVQTTYLTNSPLDPVGTPPHTNTSSFTYAINTIAGDYYIVPTNLCGIAISGLQATLVSSQTNVVSGITNLPAGLTNAQSFNQTVINYVTNHAFTYYPIQCVVSNVTLRQGIDKFTFVKTAYDSIAGRFYQPITNLYTLVTLTNSQLKTNWYQRVITKPDFLFTALDTLESGASAFVQVDNVSFFNTNNENLNLAGPGNIDPGVGAVTGWGSEFNIGFNKLGPLLVNFYNPNFIQNGLLQSSSFTNIVWGSFDGSTNAPILYPNGSSIMNLEAQILFQIITPFLTDGKVGHSYPSTQLQVVGGSSPFTWSWTAGVPTLPPGLSLSSAGVISGTPTTAGTFIFNVTATGSDSNGTTRTMQVIIDP